MSDGRDAEHFDQWYAGIVQSDRVDRITQTALGLPPDLESTSLLPWQGIADVIDALQLRSGQMLLDLACGRGGYGLEIARRTGVRLIGIDFSAVAVERARTRGTGAEFLVGELSATGLADDAVDSIVCVDAMQFATPYAAGVAECRRVLRPGGRLALTGWQARDLGDEKVPARLRIDIAAELHAVGFEEVDVREMTSWREAERAQWTAVISEVPGDDPAVAALRGEGERVLPWLDRSTRVLAVARRPARPRS